MFVEYLSLSLSLEDNKTQGKKNTEERKGKQMFYSEF